MALPWRKEYELGIVTIDEQHKKLIGIINTLSKDISEGLSRGDISSAIVRMEEYIKEHFSLEEKFFIACSYENAAEHIVEHDVFLEKTEEFRKRAKTDDAILSVEMLGYLEGWFLHHVLVTDKKYVDVFRRCGMK